MADHDRSGKVGCIQRLNPRRRKKFIAHLAQTLNVSEAARLAEIPLAAAFQAKREEPDFAAAWTAALSDGYAHLELEVLRRFIEGDQQAAPDTKYDFANAIRFLNAHRDWASRTQNHQHKVSAAEVRAAIDRKVEDLKQRIALEKRDRAEHK